MANKNQKNVVCVGGGYGGLTAVSELLRKRSQSDSFSITLIDPQAFQESRSEMDTIVAFGTNPDFCRIWFEDIYRDADVQIIQGAMKDLQSSDKTISVELVSNGEVITIPYDFLILGVGAEASMPPIKGLKERAHTVWSIPELESYLSEVHDRFWQAIYEKDIDKRRDLLTFSIIGAGATGVEIVGPLAESLRHRCIRTGLNYSEVTINLLDGLPTVLNIDLEEKQQKIAHKKIESLGIDIYLGSFVDEVTDDEIILQDGRHVNKGALVFAGGAKPAEYIAQWGLPTDHGRILVNNDLTVKKSVDDTQSNVDVSGIYALGDCASQTLEGEKMPLPLLAQHAMHQGTYVAKNIIADIRGKEHSTYGGTLLGQLVSIGDKYAIGWTPVFKVTGRFGLFVKRCSYALYWYYCGGFKFAWQRWFELRKMTKYATHFPTKKHKYM